MIKIKILAIIVLYYTIAFFLLRKEDTDKWFSPLHPVLFLFFWPFIKIINFIKKTI